MKDGWSTFLLFLAVSTSAGKSGYLEDLGVAVLHCVQCISTRFGYPNDEGLPEHPLYKHGLDQFGSEAVEVLNSPWAAEIDGQAQRSVERIWGSRGISIPGEPRKSRAFHSSIQGSDFRMPGRGYCWRNVCAGLPGSLCVGAAALCRTLND